MDDAQSKTPSARRVERFSYQRSHLADCQARTGADGGTDGGIPIGNARPLGARDDLVGGILARLIMDAEEQLDEARECIDWYTREEQKQIKRLSDLRALAESSDSQDESDDS